MWSCTDLFNRDDLNNSFIQDQWKQIITLQKSEPTLYIASFSKAPDSLEQWRAYGNFCIGFNAKELSRSGFYHYDCVYSKDDIKAWILEKGKAAEWNGDCLDEIFKKGAAFNLLNTASMKFKNEHFAAEKEVRLLATSNHYWKLPYNPLAYINDPPIYFRDHQRYQLPIPYIKFYLLQNPDDEFSDDLAKLETYQEMKEKKLELEKNCQRSLLPIREIIIGPMPNQEDVKTACEILLKENGYRNVPVIISEIPFRG